MMVGRTIPYIRERDGVTVGFAVCTLAPVYGVHDGKWEWRQAPEIPSNSAKEVSGNLTTSYR